MADDNRFQIKIDATLSLDQLGNLINLITTLLQEGHDQTKGDPTEEVVVSPTSAIGIVPGPSNDALLVLKVGGIALQFSVPLDDLFAVLDDLKQLSEPDPTSGHRPH